MSSLLVCPLNVWYVQLLSRRVPTPVIERRSSDLILCKTYIIYFMRFLIYLTSPPTHLMVHFYQSKSWNTSDYVYLHYSMLQVSASYLRIFYQRDCDWNMYHERQYWFFGGLNFFIWNAYLNPLTSFWSFQHDNDDNLSLEVHDEWCSLKTSSCKKSWGSN